MKHIIVFFLLLPLLAWGQVKPTAPLPPEESKARVQQLGDSLRKYDRFENIDRYGNSTVPTTFKNDTD